MRSRTNTRAKSTYVAMSPRTLLEPLDRGELYGRGAEGLGLGLGCGCGCVRILLLLFARGTLGHGSPSRLRGCLLFVRRFWRRSIGRTTGTTVTAGTSGRFPVANKLHAKQFNGLNTYQSGSNSPPGPYLDFMHIK
jgi:hypothetical protein